MDIRWHDGDGSSSVLVRTNGDGQPNGQRPPFTGPPSLARRVGIIVHNSAPTTVLGPPLQITGGAALATTISEIPCLPSHGVLSLRSADIARQAYRDARQMQRIEAEAEAREAASLFTSDGDSA